MKKGTLENAYLKYDPDTELVGTGNVDYGHNLADRIQQIKQENELEKAVEAERAWEFVDTTNKRGINPDNVFENSWEKAQIMRKIKGYKSLKTKGQKYGQGEKGIPFSKASESQIGKAFKSNYYSELKKINKSK